MKPDRLGDALSAAVAVPLGGTGRQPALVAG